MGSRQKLAGAADHLWRPLHRPGSECRPLLSELGPCTGVRTFGNRAAGEPQIAAPGRNLSPILVCTVRAAAGAIQRARRSAADHLRAAGFGPKQFQASKTTEPSTLSNYHHRKIPRGECNA